MTPGKNNLSAVIFLLVVCLSASAGEIPYIKRSFDVQISADTNAVRQHEKIYYLHASWTPISIERDDSSIFLIRTRPLMKSGKTRSKLRIREQPNVRVSQGSIRGIEWVLDDAYLKDGTGYYVIEILLGKKLPESIDATIDYYFTLDNFGYKEETTYRPYFEHPNLIPPIYEEFGFYELRLVDNKSSPFGIELIDTDHGNSAIARLYSTTRNEIHLLFTKH